MIRLLSMLNIASHLILQGIGCTYPQEERVMLITNEFIIEADVYSGQTNGYGALVLEGITFRTNLGNEYGPDPTA